MQIVLNPGHKRFSPFETAMDWRWAIVEHSHCDAAMGPYSRGHQIERAFDTQAVYFTGLSPIQAITPRFSLFWAVLCDKTNPPHHNGVMEREYETASIEGFVQLLACNYLPHGYWFYVTGWVPGHKDARRVDAKLVKKYGIDLNPTARARRKQLGQANMQYLRHDRFFVLLATAGKHSFFEEEAASIRDIRRTPLKFAGYSISYRRGGRQKNGQDDPKWHAHIEIDRATFQEWEAYLVDLATKRSPGWLAQKFYQLPFEPYAPVRRQFLQLLKKVNAARKRAGLQPIPHEVLPLRRRVVRPFESYQYFARAEPRALPVKKVPR